MPEARDLLDTGERYAATGVLHKALESYRAAAAAAVALPAVLAEALRREADVHRTRCAWDEALEAARRSAAVARVAGLVDLEAEAVNAEAAVLQSQGELGTAAELYTRMLNLSTNDRILGIAQQNLGVIAAQQGDRLAAEKRFLESYQHFLAAGYKRGEAIALNNYGRCLLDQDQHEQADPILRRALRLAVELGDLDLVALARLNSAEVVMHGGELSRAEELASAALGYFGLTENRWRRVECLRLLGDIALRRDRVDYARSFYEAGLRTAETIAAKLEAEQLRERLAVLDAP